MDKAVFARRRRGLMQLMGEGIAIIPSGVLATRNSDCHYRFRPESDFYYLTHWNEPDAIAVLIPGREQGEFVLFCRQRDPEKEIWDGYRAGLEGAKELYDADDAYPIEDIDEILPSLLENRSKVFTSMGKFPDFDRKLIAWTNEVKAKQRLGKSAPNEFVNLDIILHELRLVKKVEEIKLMKKAAQISCAAHIRAMRFARPGLFEYQVQAEIEHEFLSRGSFSPAYQSIVASGENACILHYIENRKQLKNGELLLIDAGAEYDCYASDITRTFPVNGKFSSRQKALYEVVLAAHDRAVETIKPGVLWNDPHEASVEVIVDGLIELGILKESKDKIIDKKLYRKFFMHRTGHWLGMDVHDVGDYKVDDTWRTLEPGMTFTVEPGIYIHPDHVDVDEPWRRIGIRIEDNILVGKEQVEILTDAVPREVADIEALMAAG